MKTGFFKAVLTVGMAALLTTTAFARSERLAVNIPFDFKVGDVGMSSGEYTVEMLSNVAVLIRSQDSPKSSVVTLSNAATPPRLLKTAGLVFNHYGDDYFLSTVSWNGNAREIPRGKVEIQAAKNLANPQRIKVSAK